MRFDKTIYIDYLPKGLKELILTKFIRTKNCNDLS